MNLAQTKRLSDYKAQNVVSRGTVLLVGDNEPFRISLAEQIDVYVGAEIVEASTGSAFLNLIHKRHFDLIILDLSGLYFGDIGGYVDLYQEFCGDGFKKFIMSTDTDKLKIKCLL